MIFLGNLGYCLERILCLYLYTDLYIRVAYLLDWIHNRKYQVDKKLDMIKFNDFCRPVIA